MCFSLLDVFGVLFLFFFFSFLFSFFFFFGVISGWLECRIHGWSSGDMEEESGDGIWKMSVALEDANNDDMTLWLMAS